MNVIVTVTVLMGSSLGFLNSSSIRVVSRSSGAVVVISPVPLELTNKYMKKSMHSKQLVHL